MRSSKKHTVVFSVIGVVGLIFVLIFSPGKTEIASSNEKLPQTPEYTFNARSALVFEAVVIREDGSSLYVKPTKLWKGNESDIETRLGLRRDCFGHFEAGATYLFLLAAKAGGSFVVDPCQLRSLKLSDNPDLSFLKGKQYQELK